MDRRQNPPLDDLLQPPSCVTAPSAMTPAPDVATAPELHLAPIPTPTTRLPRLFPATEATLVMKLDSLQLAGSTKERTAHALLTGMLERQELATGGTVVESTSGNLGIALARQCAVRGLTFVAVVDERANQAACKTMLAFGATVEVVPTPADGNRLRARRERVQELLAATPGAVTTHQYGNPDNPRAHHFGTMPELVHSLGRAPSRLYVAMSTTGTLLGCQRAIAEHGWDTELVGVDAEGSVLFGGKAGERKLPGLGAGVVTELSEQATPDRVVRVSEADMVLGCRVLAQREGLLAGASTGAIVAAVGADLQRLAAGEVVAMLMHDGGAPYLPTVFDDAWVRSELPDAGRGLARASLSNPFATV